MLIVLGASGSYLTLHSSRPPYAISNGRSPTVLRQYLGAQAYAPRIGRGSKLITVRLPSGVARMLALYSKLMTRLRSHVYARFLQAGLLIYLTSEERLVEGLKAANPSVQVDANSSGR
jgi:hypothetical protein